MRRFRADGIDQPLLLLASWLAIDSAIAVYLVKDGVGTPSRVLLLIGLVLSAAVAVRRGRSAGIVQEVSCSLIVGAHALLLVLVPYRVELPAPIDAYRLFPAVAVVGVGMALWAFRTGRQRAATVAMGVAIASGLLFRAAIVWTDIPPTFDVPEIQRAAGQAILAGTDPYLTHVFHGGFPYLPVSAFAAAAGELVGDARWASVAGDLATVIAIVWFARRMRTSTYLGLAVAAMWSWWIGAFYVTWQGFPEPIVVAFAGLGALALTGNPARPVVAGVLLGLAAATKQFGLAFLPFLLRRSRVPRVALLAAAITWVVVVVPFFLWHPQPFLDGAVLSLVDEPGRAYALNILAWPGINVDPPFAIVFGLAALFGWWCQRGQRTDVAAWLAGSAGALLLAIELNRIAFVNYYAIPLALMLFLLLTLSSGSAQPASDDREQQDRDVLERVGQAAVP